MIRRALQLGVRRRLALAILLSWPLGWIYVTWAVHTAIKLYQYYRDDGTVTCDGGVLDKLNSCTLGNFGPGVAWGELIVFSLLMIGIALLIARVVLVPVRTMAETVERLGPAGLSVRLAHSGPRDESRRLADGVDALLDRVAEGYEAQQRFAANASHELRTPLATQRALIEISLRDALTPEQLELLSRQLLATNERNERLIDGLLTLAETDRGLAVRGPVVLERLATEVVETLRPMAKERDIEVITELAPCIVQGEAPLLERLITNLVQNAIKYNDPEGWLRLSTGGGWLIVANSGPPVAPDQVSGLFEAFRRGSGDRLDHGGGVGLGLTIVRSIVSAHGGTVSAAARPDGGLEVTVSLP